MDKTIRVLQFSTHNEECGIAKYQEQFISDMSKANDLYTEYFEYSPNQTKRMSKGDLAVALHGLIKKMESFDILHIQHEISFFNNYELEQIIKGVNKLHKKVLVTIHTAPDVQYKRARLGGLGPRSFLHFAREVISGRRFLRKYVKPLTGASLVLVHNEVTKKSLVIHGVAADIIKIIRIPVPKISFDKSADEIRTHLNYKKGDIIYCTVGFLSRAKGVLEAVKALNYLPEHYKLAIIGGNHPNANDEGFYNEVTDLITELSLQKRVYITGYVAEDEKLNSLIRECDICVYPFDKKYYAYVSSASLNNAFANHRPVVAYSTKPFLELNKDKNVLTLCATSSYYELARNMLEMDIERAGDLSREYAKMYAYDKEAAKFMDIYRDLASY